MPNFNLLKRQPKSKDFLVIEIGLEKITTAIFEKEEHTLKLKGIGKKSFTKQEEVFDSVLEALDSLAALVPDLPPKGLLGISGGSLETVTTIARYTRQNPKKPMDVKETEGILENIVQDLDTTEKKIFFSTVAGANIDGVKVSNPLGLKGEKVELSCFVAFKNAEEMELLDRLMEEIDLKIEKIVPSSFAVTHFLENKNMSDALIIRVGTNKSEITSLVGGHISEILPVGLGLNNEEFLPLAWQTAILKLEKGTYPDLIWVFPDHDKVELSKAKEILSTFNWQEKLHFDAHPKIELAENIHSFSPSEISVRALGEQEI